MEAKILKKTKKGCPNNWDSPAKQSQSNTLGYRSTPGEG
jgi:hypothetical protein